MNRKTFTISAERSGRWWALACEEAGCFSQCKRLDQADAEMREAIAWQTGLAQDDFDITVEVNLPGQIQKELFQTQKIRVEAEELTSLAAAKSREIAKKLKADGLTLRDIGAVMNISYQRAGQLVA